MALTLVATPGSASANSYCTVAEGDTYHESHLYPADWNSATAATKAAALVMATRLLDNMYQWAQFPTDSVQALQWPRSGILAFNQRDFVPDTEIPQQLKNATAEFARQLITENRAADSDIETQGITSLSAGPISLSFKDTVSAKVIPDAVYYLIPTWWGYARGRRDMMRSLLRA